jgi:(2R)-ethylmalonyl-CoA mutase
VAAVFTPKDFSLTEAMAGIVTAIRKAHDLPV